MKINTQTQLCAVIGNPVGHSLSPTMHNAAFQAGGLDFVYLAFEVADVGACLDGMRAMPGFRGLSVTIPHKVAAMAHLDEVDPMARKVGCVNTITNEDGRLTGSTTDGLGTLRAFQEAGVSLADRRILFIGSGGAVRSVAFAMADRCRPECITVAGRTPKHVDTLVAALRGNTPTRIESAGLGAELLDILRDHDIVIQGTPVGMYPERIGETCVPREALRPGMTIFDMVYRPMKTRLIADAEAAGCTVILGLEMLVNQAVLQFEQWTGESAPREIMRQALVAALRSDNPQPAHANGEPADSPSGVPQGGMAGGAGASSRP